jgi:hypothetical protein
MTVRIVLPDVGALGLVREPSPSDGLCRGFAMYSYVLKCDKRAVGRN